MSWNNIIPCDIVSQRAAEEEAVELIVKFFGGNLDKVEDWFHTSNPHELTSNGYTFSVMTNGDLWIKGPDGDGMQLSKKSLDNIWKDYM